LVAVEVVAGELLVLVQVQYWHLHSASTVPNCAKAETVTQIALWRYHEGLGYAAIADRLNADLGRYPPPEPPGGAARPRRVGQIHRGRHPAQPQVHRLPGVQPAGDPVLDGTLDSDLGVTGDGDDLVGGGWFVGVATVTMRWFPAADRAVSGGPVGAR